MLNNLEDGAGVVMDFSASGASVKTDISAVPGDRIVLHLDGGSRFEGVVSRCYEGGLAVEFGMHENKRQRLVDALESVMQGASTLTSLPLKNRVSPRIGGFRSKVVCSTGSQDFECRLVDMSLGGAAVEMDTDAGLATGTAVILGQTSGRIVRREGNVYGIRFDTKDAGAGEGPAEAEK